MKRNLLLLQAMTLKHQAEHSKLPLIARKGQHLPLNIILILFCQALVLTVNVRQYLKVQQLAGRTLLPLTLKTLNSDQDLVKTLPRT